MRIIKWCLCNNYASINRFSWNDPVLKLEVLALDNHLWNYKWATDTRIWRTKRMFYDNLLENPFLKFLAIHFSHTCLTISNNVKYWCLVSCNNKRKMFLFLLTFWSRRKTTRWTNLPTSIRRLWSFRDSFKHEF